MIGREMFFGNIPASELSVDKNELAARLQASRNYGDAIVSECESTLRKEIDCGYSALRTEVSFPAENTVDFGFCKMTSKNLYKNLSGCGEAYLFAVTLGYGVDRLIKKLSVVSAAEHFVTDALASAFAEAACEKVDKILRKSSVTPPRFSPGYGDLPLAVQPAVLEALEAGKRLNITLTEALLMSPSKSITAIAGIRL